MAIQAVSEGSSIRSTESQWLDQSDSSTPVVSGALAGLRSSPDATNSYTSATNTVILSWNMRSSLRPTFTIDRAYTLITPPDLIVGSYHVDFTNSSTGGFPLSWGSVFVWPDDIEPTFNTAPGAKNIYQFYCDGVAIYGKIFYQTPFIA